MLPLLAPIAFAGDPPSLGIPLDRLPSIGLLAPTAAETGAMRYPLASGGLVTLRLAADAQEAELLFDGWARTAVTRWPASDLPLPGDQARGDGRALALIRFGNAVVLVRDFSGDAAGVASRVQGALTADPKVCAGISREEPDGSGGALRFDRCGRRAP